jgi:urease accessory protein UreF
MLSAERAQLARLQLFQLLDSQFPIGQYAHSCGLETYAHLALDSTALTELLISNLEAGMGRLDAAACVLAYKSEGFPTLALLCEELSSWKVIPGLYQTSISLGKRLLTLLQRILPGAPDFKLDEPHQAVVLGAVGRWLDIELEALILGYVQSGVIVQLAAATRCMRLSPEQAQEIVVTLQPKMVALVKEVLSAPADNLYAATPALDIRAYQQAYLYTRLFQS